MPGSVGTPPDLLPYDGPAQDPAPPEGGFLAAVSLILTELPGRDPAAARFLLIRRARYEGDPWSGQMALPGGRRDPLDPSLLATAIRETREETLVDLAGAGRLLGRLPTVTPRTPHLPPLSVVPFVFVLSSPVTPTAASREVAEVLWAPLSLLVQEAARTTHHLAMGGARLTFPALDVEGRTVWGLTHRILEDFRIRVGPLLEG